MPADGLQDGGQFFEFRAFANIYDQRGAADLAGLHGQFGKLRNQFYREIVDTVIAQVFKGLQD